MRRAGRAASRRRGHRLRRGTEGCGPGSPQWKFFTVGSTDPGGMRRVLRATTTSVPPWSCTSGRTIRHIRDGVCVQPGRPRPKPRVALTRAGNSTGDHYLDIGIAQLGQADRLSMIDRNSTGIRLERGCIYIVGHPFRAGGGVGRSFDAGGVSECVCSRSAADRCGHRDGRTGPSTPRPIVGHRTAEHRGWGRQLRRRERIALRSRKRGAALRLSAVHT